MALSNEEMDRLKRLLETRKGADFSKMSQSKPAGQDLLGDLTETGQGVADAFSKGKKKVNEALNASIENPNGNIGTDLKALGQAFGAGAGATADIIGETVVGAGKAVLSEETEQGIKETATAVAEPVMNSAPVKALIDQYNSLDEDTKRSVDAVLGVGALATEFVGVGLAPKIAKPVLNVAGKTTEAVVDTVKAGADKIAPALGGTMDVVKGTLGAGKRLYEGAKEIPGNMATNLAEKEAVEATIKALPTPVAQNAAKRGIEVPDVKTVIDVAKGASKQTDLAKTLFQTVKSFAKGESTIDPISIVGKPIVARLKTLEKGREKVGKELGAVAQKLGTVTTKEVATPIFKALQEVPGLKGLTVDKKGVLDFTDTVLATGLTKADRTAIAKVWREAIKAGTGRSKHLLRQELFELLDGKKKSLSNITDTQDKAFQAVRKGLSDVLEGKNPRYKTLSNQYRKIIQPMKDMRKMMGEIPGATEDILDMQAGLLARRITSAAKSNPQVRAILKSMDDALGKGGDTTVKVEALQDLYNIFDRYYDISPKTGFQGQIKNAINAPSGVLDLIKKTVVDVGGETSAVRQKAFEELFEEVFK